MEQRRETSQTPADGEPLYERGTIDNASDREAPIDETDLGPQPVIIRKNDAQPRNTNVEEHPTIAAEDAKNQR